ncbi:MAG: T9SS type A sorting domain-containing protein [Saprospiraceae bacterium]|nr:T9SS type A sorting domain-containing protein [Saprospiraceae bacterium]
MTGYSYELDYNVDVVDENTLEVGFYDNGWAAQNATLLHMYKNHGMADWKVVLVGQNGKKVSGKGGVELITFIVEDDLGGFRREDDKIPFFFKNIQSINEEGRILKLQDQVAYLRFTKNEEPTLDPDALIIYPVPASDILTMHLNGKNKLISLALYSLSGNVIKLIENPDAKHNQIELDGIQNGLYLLKAETILGPITKKVEIIR